ncbi:Predicted dienelactone hydrolase [Rhodospirillales bacterium URHD0017]|nr:Predicted dienelactone hydrolase [Rhodospirillales bacterium URHD0017]
MRSLMFSLLLALAGISTASADPRSFHAGTTRVTVEDTTPFDALITYPTEADEATVEEGLFSLSASRDAPVAAGARFPVVLFSHGGGGQRPGTPLAQRDLLLHLARQGFIVIAPFHPGSERPFVDRPRHIHKALDSVLADPRFSRRADPDRIAMAGFSFGGAVSLIAAGASVDLAHLSAYCRDHPDDTRACGGIVTDGSWAKVPPSAKSDDVLPLKALVLLEPYGAPFERKGLGSLDLPILIYAALQSDLRPEGNALALAKALPRPPQQVAVPGGHFVFVDPCSPTLAARAPEVCSDPPGADRAAIHQRSRRQIADFLRANL